MQIHVLKKVTWPPIDITRMKNYVLSPLIENLTMMTSSIWKINVIFLVGNCLSYNISKFGSKLTTGKRDNLTWTKINVTSSFKNTFLELRCQFDDFLAFLWGQGGMKSYLQLMLFPTMLKKRILWMILRVILFWKMACFWANLHYIAHSSTSGF